MILRCLGDPPDPPIDISYIWTRPELFTVENLAVTSHCDPYPQDSKCEFSYIFWGMRTFTWTLPDPSRVRTCKLDTYGIYINDL